MIHDSALRIVHVCNFHYNRNGDKYDTMDAKIHLGLIENGHYAYPFPFHDIARQNSWRNNKRAGAKKANNALVETCQKIRPAILLLGHSQTVDRVTIEKIKRTNPEIKVAQWFCDWFYSERLNSFKFIYERLDVLDNFFATTAGTHLASFNKNGCRASFVPNPTHPAVESYRSFDSHSHQYDLVFIGSDRKDPERREMLLEIESKLGKKHTIGIFGSLGRPSIFGHAKDQILSQSKAALNLTRLPEPMKWYSSDRIVSIMGNGLLNCTRADADLHELYGSNAIMEYSDVSELIEKMDHCLDSNRWKETAERGWQISHDYFSAKKVTAFMIDTIFNEKSIARWEHLNSSSTK